MKLGFVSAILDGWTFEEMMDTALASFDKQLDALYADEALDISSEIKVMENMFAAEGVKEDEITLSL